MESDADLVAATAAAGGTILGKCLFEANFVISLILHIFPLKINWSHLSEVGECGIAVRWAHSRITP